MRTHYVTITQLVKVDFDDPTAFNEAMNHIRGSLLRPKTWLVHGWKVRPERLTISDDICRGNQTGLHTCGLPIGGCLDADFLPSPPPEAAS